MRKNIRVALVGSEKEKAEELLTHHGDLFSLVDTDPDIVISFGGDGTLMGSEFLFPGVPKLYLKNSAVGKLAHDTDNTSLVTALATGTYFIVEHPKLEVRFGGKILLGLNDIVIHNKDPRHAIRYRVFVDNEQIHEEIIGDGVVFATPLGSTGYYRSITDSSFEVGIGLAFNNSTEQSDHIVLGDTRTVTIEIVRGPAVCYADNQVEHLDLAAGDKIQVAKSEKVARIIRV